MPDALFTVKATIASDREKEFNEWYNQRLRKEFDASFGAASERQRAAYVQVWP